MDLVDAVVFDDDNNEELRKYYERARNLALKRQEGLAKTFPESIASLIATRRPNNLTPDDNPSCVSEENKQVVFTETGEFVSGLHQFDELDEQKHVDVLPNPSIEEKEPSVKEEETGITPDETIREVPIGKGLSVALKRLRERGTLKEDIERGGRNTDKKKSKLGGDQEEGEKVIHIERTDEYGRILTEKEQFRLLSHQFHGKGPGKKKQEKRMRQYQQELEIKKMNNSY
ncbi:SART-1 family protein DOT2-like [Nicotiana sylvestris]|uniref:U4/U6.U5 tri-snRNP-associated protein 1-like n=1 Tax=Nicotiana sylvestris TaxID=4096 RepID=A0A1U7YGT1_NICSY|nr:PREDICTED: U4/U6.U5 tri-snRNP-associated protein 1-like [Nicotiana sylvestris]XP_009798436.1 PREDICTED: U4/U6.U5 tri-snRNP-associated protein 1-like [Nicotiana sylvestris]XP_009798437.1 PREDICTED: U4/U6.U5 tri-snRNP-associated protein 1-like [Nicotiana sylvestris]XP_009798438.1 PREDICTED: U4/U6.U5 tri-snRNP-associated protein 1-like [Nicotiana sylvestris]XP_009798439.1 PREDICTED: U4/U6.U5 tri-snRNP-associated protein 1-like [Nicotiana sylvestris]XP_009798440.1 PREDICTED: U4/U6.U5 tri-snRNP-